MAICEQCGNEYGAKRSTSRFCSPKCKQLSYRNKDKVTVTPTVTLSPEPVMVTDLEKCRYCGEALPVLSRPRIYPGSCCSCALKQPSQPKPPATEGHILSSRSALEFTGVMTDFEREHYKPIDQLGKGEFNPVSKPGDSYYNAHTCTGLEIR